MSSDTLAEWLRRRPAKPMGSPRVGSNPTGVDFVCAVSRFLAFSRFCSLVCSCVSSRVLALPRAISRVVEVSLR